MIELIVLTAAVWLAYIGVIECGFVSDDIEGLLYYDGKLKKFDYGHFNKWILYKLLGKSHRRNHFFSVLLHNTNTCLLYTFLCTVVSQPMAFAAALMFALHPLNVQAVAWISGRGYPISLLLLLTNLNLLQLYSPLPTNSWLLLLLTFLFVGLYYVSIAAQFTALMTAGILFLLGHTYFAGLGVAISLVAGLGLVRTVIKGRAENFKAQNLGESTRLHPRKIVFALKSLAYYTFLCLFPKRLGLYHTYEYHYGEHTNKEDRMFWCGLLIFLGLAAGFWYGNFAVRLGILWYLAYIVIFLNWITIQQTYAERYAYISNIGICLLLAFAIHSYPVLVALLCGLYLMRTWTQLPAYNDEVMFYQSNIWNFPNSEVAFTNLGVVYMKLGLEGSAMDMWNIATRINKDYDVGYYNMHAIHKKSGNLKLARELLVKAIESKQSHFKEGWSKELVELDHEIGYVTEIEQVARKLAEIEKTRPENKPSIDALRKQLEDLQLLHDKIKEQRQDKVKTISDEQGMLQSRLVELSKKKEAMEKPVDAKDLLAMRDKNFHEIKEAVRVLSHETPQPRIPTPGQSG